MAGRASSASVHTRAERMFASTCRIALRSCRTWVEKGQPADLSVSAQVDNRWPTNPTDIAHRSALQL